MSAPLLRINGLPIALPASLELDQVYTRLAAETVLRMSDGAGIKQSAGGWAKLVTRISAGGSAPPALALVDWTQPVTIDCVGPRQLATVTSAVTLPAARRPDVAVCAFAMLPSGRLVRTAVDVTDDAATLTPVAGAVGYVTHYYPRLVCWSDGPEEQSDVRAALMMWTLTAEEA